MGGVTGVCVQLKFQVLGQSKGVCDGILMGGCKRLKEGVI